MDGLFLENGPLRLVQDDSGDYRVRAAPHSWHRAPAYTVYIDQPVGTGLSFATSGRYPIDFREINVDFLFFLQSFFHLHADKFTTINGTDRDAVHTPVYFTGESVAGKYIPSMMNHILRQNQEGDSDGDRPLKIPLMGAAIGNGWIHPHYQYSPARLAHGKGLIDNAQLAALNLREATCQRLLKDGEYDNDVCFRLLNDVIDHAFGIGAGYILSMYDARKRESGWADRDFPPGHKAVETYLGGHPLPSGVMPDNIYKQVLVAIHAEAVEQDHTYKECTDPPYDALSHLDGKDVVKDVVGILEHQDNIRMLFFNGVEDMICNHIGNEELLENLPWKYQTEWTKAKRYAWKAKEEDESVVVSGYMKEYENLMFLKILSAGHMVPLDVPATALEMMQLFIGGGSFSAFEQGLDSAIPSSCSNDDEEST